MSDRPENVFLLDVLDSSPVNTSHICQWTAKDLSGCRLTRLGCTRLSLVPARGSVTKLKNTDDAHGKPEWHVIDKLVRDGMI